MRERTPSLLKHNDCVGMTGNIPYVPAMFVVVVLRLEHSHSFIASLVNHSTASGPAWCRRCRPPGNAVSGHSSTMCLVVWWLSPQSQAGDAITPIGGEIRRICVGSVNPGCVHVGLVTISCPGPGGTP